MIELLLVVAIISILAGIVIAIINPEKQRARVRDAGRQKDIQTLSLALEQYYADNNAYPAGSGTNLSSLTAALIGGTTTYIKAMPTDPVSGYSYCYNLINSQNYVMCAVQESHNDQETAPDGTSCNPSPANMGRYCVSNPL